MTGLEQPELGTVTVAGEDLRRLDEDQLARFRGRTSALCFKASI